MSNKMIVVSIIVVLALLGGWFCKDGLVGHNDDQDWQILQGVWGKMSVRTDSGFYGKKFATVYPYSKVRRIYFSSDVREGSALDESCKVVFSDKGTATFSSMVLYRAPYIHAGESIGDEGSKSFKEGKVSNFHRLCRGDMSIADKTILARIKEYARIRASSMNASQSVENQATFIDAIRSDVKTDETLVKYGIEIEELALSDIVFDGKTLLQFEKQQDAILASKKAEAEAIKFEMQKLETIAEYAQKIAEQKGLAEMEMMKQTTDAERDAELARIDAQKKVTVETLAKEQALVKANKALAVAKVEKEEALTVAQKKLEVAKKDALAALETKKGMIAIAEGKEKAIKLSGAITEQEKVLAQIAAQRDVDISKNLTKIQSPSTVFLSSGKGGDGGSGSGTYFNNLLSYTIAQNAGLLPEANGNKKAPVNITNVMPAATK